MILTVIKKSKCIERLNKLLKLPHPDLFAFKDCTLDKYTLYSIMEGSS